MRLLVTGSSGLIGSETVAYFDSLGHEVVGVDNNMRADFFGPPGDTLWNQKRLQAETDNFQHFDLDIRNREEILQFFDTFRPQAIIHSAAQPSHDLAAARPLDDFDVNAVGTMNLLEATRYYCPESPFLLMSTNKVYGDAPNELPLKELEKRWDYADKDDYDGIDETCRIDQSKHSIFGASKVSADVMTQEYGRYYGMPTACFRAGCVTGPRHAGVELHGFLSYLVKVAVAEVQYTIFGYKGKQVRDQIHSCDVVRLFEEVIASPPCGEVYNLGGGRTNSVSILETFDMIEALTGKKIDYKYDDKNREGDHICYISDLGKLKKDYPQWSLTRSVDNITEEIVRREKEKQ